MRKHCENCGHLFVFRGHLAKYCSNACRQRAYRKRKKKAKGKERSEILKVWESIPLSYVFENRLFPLTEKPHKNWISSQEWT